MTDRPPLKPAVSIHPGEYVLDGETRQMVLGVTYWPHRDNVTLKFALGTREYRLDDRVCCLPRDG